MAIERMAVSEKESQIGISLRRLRAKVWQTDIKRRQTEVETRTTATEGTRHCMQLNPNYTKWLINV